MDVRIKGVVIHIDEHRGEGVPEDRALLFVHGAGGSSRVWRNQADGLMERWRILALDLPGHGLSQGDPEGSITGYSRCVREVVEKLNGEMQLILLGHSMGGAIAMDVALDPPEGLRGVVLVGTGAKLRVMDQIFKALSTDPDGFLRSMEDWAFGSSATPQLKGEALEIMRGCPPEVTISDFRACDAFDIRDRLGEIDLPTMIICGDEDRLTPLRYSEYLQDRIQGARLVVISRAGHMVMSERPAPLNAAIEDFAGQTFS